MAAPRSNYLSCDWFPGIVGAFLLVHAALFRAFASGSRTRAIKTREEAVNKVRFYYKRLLYILYFLTFINWH